MKISRKILFALLLLVCACPLATNPIDSIRAAMPGQADTSKAKSLLHISRHFLQKNTDSSLLYSKKALGISRDIGFTAGIGSAYIAMGRAYEYKSKIDNALIYYKKALGIYKQAGMKKPIATAYSEIGIAYKKAGKYDIALEYFQKSLKALEGLGNAGDEARILNNIGLAYFDFGEYEAALAYHRQSIEKWAEHGDSLEFASAYLNAGSDYHNMGLQDSAEFYYKKALPLFKIKKDSLSIAKAFNNLGLVLKISGKYREALRYFRKSLALKKRFSIKTDIISAYRNMGVVFMETGIYDSALYYYNSALKIAKDNNFNLAELDSYRHLSDFYSKIGDYKNAFEFYKKYKEFADSLYTINMHKRLAELEYKFQNEKKEKENATLKAEREKQTSYLIILAAISGLLILIAIFLYAKNKSKRKINKLLKEKNEKILSSYEALRQKSEEINYQKEQLKGMNETKDKFLSMIAHDLKNPFWAIYEMSKMQYLKKDTLSPEKKDSFTKMIYHSAEKLYKFLDNLLKWSGARTGAIEFNPRPCDLRAIIENALNINKKSAELKGQSIATEFSGDLIAYADLAMAASVASNLINNAVKFTPGGGSIKIKAEKYDGFIQVAVIDNGKGISIGRLENLFTLESIKPAAGTDNEEGSGIGLLLCKEFVEKNGGRLSAESEINSGSVFTFTLPAYLRGQSE